MCGCFFQERRLRCGTASAASTRPSGKGTRASFAHAAAFELFSRRDDGKLERCIEPSDSRDACPHTGGGAGAALHLSRCFLAASSPPDSRKANAMIELVHQDGVAILRMAHGKANAMDTEFCDAIAASFAEHRRWSSPAMVMMGSGRIFSAGSTSCGYWTAGRRTFAAFCPS